MGWVLAGAAVAAGVYFGAKYLASHRETSGPHEPPPQPVDLGDAGAPDGGVH